MNFTLSFCPLILSVLTEEIGFTALVMLNAITKPKGQKSGSKIRMYGQDREVACRVAYVVGHRDYSHYLRLVSRRRGEDRTIVAR